ncbi:hypothetical protein Pan97_44290 [Bremerella volcania]|uniref:Uncharacterized protein n=1 Tax=Bremerella volcania TaxID=2527984 RepID=A0A518CDS5_9BACT|nr:hypothetical protein [Bremerella volcania]QDU77362.1 hypothetical protein Pan97_44290 [Bremerella volcania]
MRSNIINIRANFAAVVARVFVVAVDVIRNASATCLRLYGHTWQQYGPKTWGKQSPPKPSEHDLPCDALRCLGGDSLLLGSTPSMSLSMRSPMMASLGLLPRS